MSMGGINTEALSSRLEDGRKADIIVAKSKGAKTEWQISQNVLRNAMAQVGLFCQGRRR
jgi:hypothetical protein